MGRIRLWPLHLRQGASVAVDGISLDVPGIAAGPGSGFWIAVIRSRRLEQLGPCNHIATAPGGRCGHLEAAPCWPNNTSVGRQQSAQAGDFPRHGGIEWLMAGRTRLAKR